MLRNELNVRWPCLKDQPFADLLMPGSSLYDLALAVFPGERKMLNEHFRCVERIIRFSFRFYPEKIVPVRIPKASERLDPPLVDVYVTNGNYEPRRKINQTEALAIVDEIERLTRDPAYEDRSIGVVSLIGWQQAHHVQNLLIERLGEERFLRHRITCGDSATFQGKKRDIMFVSMLASPGKAAAKTARPWEQRFNVALSRARDRMYLFRSVEPADLRNPKDLKLKVISHFHNPMPAPAVDARELIDLCHPAFERPVFQRLLAMGYRVTPQVPVGECFIDLVVEGEQDRRLAIELDGDRYHGPDRWLEDWNRQKILESAGWTFWRCWASSFALDPEACMDDLVANLREMGIDPIGHGQGRHPYTEHRTVAPDATGIPEPVPKEDEESEASAEVGDRVVVSFEDDRSRQYALTLSANEHDPLNGIISVDESEGRALLNGAVADEINLERKGKTRTATILQIDKAALSPAEQVTGGEHPQTPEPDGT